MSRFSAVMREVDDLAASSTKGRLSWSSTDSSTPCTPNLGRDGAGLGRPCDESTPISSSSKSDETADSLMSLSEINEELQDIITKVNNGEAFDEKRLDYLIEQKNDHPEHQMNLERENREWMLSIEDFLAESLARTRSFLPVDISRLGSVERIVDDSGLDVDIAKRILEKKALWLCRMKDTDISRIHIVDLLNKYNPMGTNLDIIETAAVFACMPEYFNADADGRKGKFRDDLVVTLKEMMNDERSGRLPAVRCRHPFYRRHEEAGDLYGPVDDITSTLVSRIHSVSGISTEELDGSKPRRRSFTEVCKRHSLLSRERRITTDSRGYGDNGDDEAAIAGSLSGSDDSDEDEHSVEVNKEKKDSDNDAISAEDETTAKYELERRDATRDNTQSNSSGKSGEEMARAYNMTVNRSDNKPILSTAIDVGDTAPASESSSPSSEKEEKEEKEEKGKKEEKKKSAFEKGTNLYVEYGGEDLVHYGWLHRCDRVVSSNSNSNNSDKAPLSFSKYFVVCTRSDSFLRVFDHETDVEESSTIYLQNFTSCVRVSGVAIDAKEEEEGVWRDSTCHLDNGGRETDVPKKGMCREELHYFTLSSEEAGTWYFGCENAALADYWVARMQPLLKGK